MQAALLLTWINNFLHFFAKAGVPFGIFNIFHPTFLVLVCFTAQIYCHSFFVLCVVLISAHKTTS